MGWEEANRVYWLTQMAKRSEVTRIKNEKSAAMERMEARTTAALKFFKQKMPDAGKSASGESSSDRTIK